MNKITSI